MPKYNLALIPVSIGNEVVKYANHFSNLADNYLLGKNAIPHVTLYQFEANEKEIVEIWQNISYAWEEKPIELMFKKFSFISFDSSLFWLSLLPDHSSQLHRMHSLIAKVLNKPIKNSYDPHMTLLNTKKNHYEKIAKIIFENSYKPLSDKFVLSLGKSDEVGQLIEVLFVFDSRVPLTV